MIAFVTAIFIFGGDLTFGDIESRFKKSRDSIKTSHVKIEVKTRGKENGKEISDTEGEYEIWNDGVRMRMDKLMYGFGDNAPGVKIVTTINHDLEGSVFSFREKSSGYIARTKKGISDIADNKVLDIRSIGLKTNLIHSMIQDTNGSQYGIIAGTIKDKKLTFVKDKNGKTFGVLTGTTPNTSQVKMTLDPDFDYMPIKIELLYDTKDLKSERASEFTYSKYNNIIYPSRMTTKTKDFIAKTVDGKNVTREFEEVVKMDKVEFNTKISDNLFTYEGMGMKPGDVITNNDFKTQIIFAQERIPK